ncbi:MAG: D-sedoheptulose 7-phosphate isomerase [Micromonosporaceae bacterium]|nr:D-sedoheptulose 7-phosphate isomerase [Micromonosporaceae bacterium]
MRDDTPGVVDNHLAALAAALVPYRAAADRLAQWGGQLAWTLGRGGRLLVAGNGGSAAEAQHFAAELIGRLREDRTPLSAVALCADSAAVTAISNDYGFENMFARQVRGHGRPGDILVVLSTSGRSANLLAAVTAAREGGMRTWALTGPAPNPLAAACDEAITCPCADSQIVQELHLVSVHLICEYVDRTLPVVLGSGTRHDAARCDTGGPGAPTTCHDPIGAAAPVADRVPDLVGRSAGVAHRTNGYGGGR